MRNAGEVRKAVRDRYGEIARGERAGCGPEPSDERAEPGTSASSCCGSESTSSSAPGAGATLAKASSCCSGPGELARADSPSVAMGYSDQELGALPEGADLGLGCGNPGAIAALRPGETLIDLGSGGGIDCFLAAERVGSAGRVIGVDMTPDMVERARENAVKVEAENVEFRLGEIENLPVPDDTADVVISNCVINLSPDKARVYREAFRVLKPGGRLAISDIVARSELPEKIRADLDLHTACVAGAAVKADVEKWLGEAGFVDVRVSWKQDAKPDGLDSVWDYLGSAVIEGRKPA